METLKIYGFFSAPALYLPYSTWELKLPWWHGFSSSVSSSRDTTGLHLQFLLPALHLKTSLWEAEPHLPFFPTSHRSLSFAALLRNTPWKPFFPMFCLDFSCFRQESKSCFVISILARCKNLFCLCSSFIFTGNHVAHSLLRLTSLTQHYAWPIHVACISSFFSLFKISFVL